MDIMSGAPVFEKILGSKFFTPRVADDQEQYSALRMGVWMGPRAWEL